MRKTLLIMAVAAVSLVAAAVAYAAYTASGVSVAALPLYSFTSALPSAAPSAWRTANSSASNS